MQVRSEIDHELGVVLVVLRGAPGPESASSVRRVLDAVPRGLARVIVDVRDLGDVEPALALVLLELDDRLAGAGGWLWLVHGPGPAGSSLRFMGVHDRIRSYPSLVAAGWEEQASGRRRATGPRSAARRRPAPTRGRAHQPVRTRR